MGNNTALVIIVVAVLVVGVVPMWISSTTKKQILDLAAQEASFEKEILLLLDKHEQENNAFIQKWKGKENFTTQDLRELTLEYENLRLKHRNELQEILRKGLVQPAKEEDKGG